MRPFVLYILVGCYTNTLSRGDDESALLQTRVGDSIADGIDPPRPHPEDPLSPGVLYWQAETTAPNFAALAMQMVAAAIHNHLYDPWIIHQRNLIDQHVEKQKTSLSIGFNAGDPKKRAEKTPMTKQFAGWDKVPQGGNFAMRNDGQLPSTERNLALFELGSEEFADKAGPSEAGLFKWTVEKDGEEVDAAKVTFDSGDVGRFNFKLEVAEVSSRKLKIKDGVIDVLIQNYWDAYGYEEHSKMLDDKVKDEEELETTWRPDQKEYRMSCPVCGGYCAHDYAGGMGEDVVSFKMLLPECGSDGVNLEGAKMKIRGTKFQENPEFKDCGVSGKLQVNLKITDKDGSSNKMYDNYWELEMKLEDKTDEKSGKIAETKADKKEEDKAADKSAEGDKEADKSAEGDKEADKSAEDDQAATTDDAAAAPEENKGAAAAAQEEEENKGDEDAAAAQEEDKGNKDQKGDE